MIEPKRNLYKSVDTFRCMHDVHHPFKSAMSPFHILKQKQCFPHGCVYFIWKCRLLAKQKKCFRGFEHVGRKCFNCRYFDEEKQHQYPEFIQNGQTVNDFMQSYEDFEDWVKNMQQRRVLVEGNVSSIIPDLKIHWQNRGTFQLRAYGFLVRFEQGYFDNIPFNDPFYLSISPITQSKLLLRRNDELEFEAQLLIDRGRFKFIKSGRFQFLQRGTEHPLRRNDVLTALSVYTLQQGQPGKCLTCAHGILVESAEGEPETGPTRHLVCLQGVGNYKDCALCSPTNGLSKDSCANPEWDGQKNCHHVL